MPSRTMTQAEQKHYFLITNVVANNNDAEIDLDAESWKLPYSIDDSDLQFDGKPLNMLYEENKWKAEHHVGDPRDAFSKSTSCKDNGKVGLVIHRLF
jgi:hypothetical protein